MSTRVSHTHAGRCNAKAVGGYPLASPGLADRQFMSMACALSCNKCVPPSPPALATVAHEDINGWEFRASPPTIAAAEPLSPHATPPPPAAAGHHGKTPPVTATPAKRTHTLAVAMKLRGKEAAAAVGDGEGVVTDGAARARRLFAKAEKRLKPRRRKAASRAQPAEAEVQAERPEEELPAEALPAATSTAGQSPSGAASLQLRQALVVVWAASLVLAGLLLGRVVLRSRRCRGSRGAGR